MGVCVNKKSIDIVHTNNNIIDNILKIMMKIIMKMK